MRVSRVALGLVLAAVAGCGQAPELVPGSPAPVTASPSAGSSPTTAATASETVELSGYGVTVRVPVPAGWTRRSGDRPGAVRTDVDATDIEVLLRIELTARQPGSVRNTISAARGGVSNGYRLLGVDEVEGVGDEAVDWRFTFVRDGRTRQVIDRLIATGDAGIALYYSAPQELYERYLPVWTAATSGVAIS